MTNNEKNLSDTDIIKYIEMRVNKLVSQSIRNDILKIYWEYKPRYVPDFIYRICLRRFMLMEYYNLGSITKIVEHGKKIIDNEKREILSKQAKTIGYELIKSDI